MPKKFQKLLILILCILVIIGIYSYVPKKLKTKQNDLFVLQYYCHSFLDTIYELDNINHYPTSTKKQIDYILTVNQVKKNFLTAHYKPKDTENRLFYIWEEIYRPMLDEGYKHVTISQLLELKRGIQNPYEHCKCSEYWAPANYPKIPEESFYLKN